MPTIFCAVRSCNGGEHEYVDVDTAAASRKLVERHVNTDAEIIPEWHEERPVVRIAEFELVEKEVS